MSARLFQLWSILVRPQIISIQAAAVTGLMGGILLRKWLCNCCDTDRNIKLEGGDLMAQYRYTYKYKYKHKQRVAICFHLTTDKVWMWGGGETAECFSGLFVTRKPSPFWQPTSRYLCALHADTRAHTLPHRHALSCELHVNRALHAPPAFTPQGLSPRPGFSLSPCISQLFYFTIKFCFTWIWNTSHATL